jgi:hypothetical protein
MAIDIPDIMERLSGAVMAIGALVCIFGIIQFIIAWQDGFTGGGAQIFKALGLVAAGAVTMVLSGLFMTIDWSWATTATT